MGWDLEPGTVLEMGVPDAVAGASELGTGKICRVRLKAVRSQEGDRPRRSRAQGRTMVRMSKHTPEALISPLDRALGERPEASISPLHCALSKPHEAEFMKP